eukprot:2979813-Prymnesium_polylepis.1
MAFERCLVGFACGTGLLPHETIRLWPRIPAERERSRPEVVCQKDATRSEECIGAIQKCE